MNISESKRLLAKLKATNEKLKQTATKVKELNAAFEKQYENPKKK